MAMLTTPFMPAHLETEIHAGSSLETARALWVKRDRQEAVRWIRRAAENAEEAVKLGIAAPPPKPEIVPAEPVPEPENNE